MLPDETKVDSFTEFVAAIEPRLRQALTAAFGPDLGREATAEALAYGWEHWERLAPMDNPVGYLYRVGRSAASRWNRPARMFPAVDRATTPWIEPGLADAVGSLSEKQRTVVLLLHAYDWTMTEVAEALGVAKSTVQNHADRAMKRLRRTLKVDA